MSDFQSNYPREANVSPDPWSMELDGLNRTANIGRIVATIFGFVVGILIVGPILVGRWHIQSPLYITVESTFA